MDNFGDSSIRGKVLKEMLEHFTHDLRLGKMMQTGELRKRLHEPPYISPPGINITHFDRDHYSMEFMSRSNNPKKDKVILYFHGGGYIGGILNRHYGFGKAFIDASDGFCVLIPDYRVAPENTYPAALEDALDAYKWLLDSGVTADNIFLAGDSAGGGLSIALSMYLRDHRIPLPRAIIAMSPWTDLIASGDSYIDNYDKDPLFGNTRESMIYINPYPGEYDKRIPYISPVYGDFSELPRMLIQVGGDEMLLSDSLMTAERATNAGVEVTLSVYEGMFHVFQTCMQLIPESKRAWEEIEKFFHNI